MPRQSPNPGKPQGNRTLLKLIEKARRHASIAGGNFSRLFAGAEIPPLPATVARLVKEVGRDEPNLHRVSDLITATPEIASKVLQTVNSAYFALPKPVSSIMRAVTMLGLRQIRPLILSFSLKKSLSLANHELFDQQGFWSDALLKALIARGLADCCCRDEREEAFTAMLLADIALPVLLTAWGEYYEAVVRQWQVDQTRLSYVEQESFRWDHAQAGAWILQTWEFPPELVCLVGLHNTNLEKLRQLGLQNSAALPVVIAALTPSNRQPSAERARRMIDAALGQLPLESLALAEILGQAQVDFREMCGLFDLTPESGLFVFEVLDQVLAGTGEGGRP
jgi:HD-like signal output (HDOD) protein